MLTKSLTILMTFGMLAALPGTALAANVAVEEHVAIAPGPVAIDTSGNCPPDVRTCIANASQFTCQVARMSYDFAVWLVERTTGRNLDAEVYLPWAC